MPGGNKNIRPEDGKQFSSTYQPAEKWTEKVALQLADDLIAWMNEKDEDGEDKGNMFFEEFLIIERDLNDDTINYLSRKFSSFSARITKAKRIQEIKLKKYGVGDRLNATMTKFVLNVNHGLVETTKTENRNETIQSEPLKINIIQDGNKSDKSTR